MILLQKNINKSYLNY